jgi:hypothetical protein
MQFARARARLRSAMCRAWTGSPEARAAAADLGCPDPVSLARGAMTARAGAQ